ncbi:hypothetical protein [Streptomyces lydicamycinicus]|uniref:hypothetical protein n=1 Tax=Streptomyces lydicamycinicus TaxID=1546107 RepID=UPI003C2B314B
MTVSPVMDRGKTISTVARPAAQRRINGRTAARPPSRQTLETAAGLIRRLMPE